MNLLFKKRSIMHTKFLYGTYSCSFTKQSQAFQHQFKAIQKPRELPSTNTPKWFYRNTDTIPLKSETTGKVSKEVEDRKKQEHHSQQETVSDLPNKAKKPKEPFLGMEKPSNQHHKSKGHVEQPRKPIFSAINTPRFGRKDTKIVIRNENNKDELMTDNKVLQMKIVRIQTVEALLDFYRINKDNLDVINVCTCFNQVVQLANKSNKRSLANLKGKEEIQQMITSLKEKTEHMNDFTVSNFLRNLAKLDIADVDLINKLVQMTLENKIEPSELSITYITWALGRFNIMNGEFLDFVAKRFEDTFKEPKLKSLCNVFWTMSELGYRSQHIIDLMGRYITEYQTKFDDIELNLVFLGYSKYKLVDWTVLDHLSKHAIQNTKKLSLRTLANIINCCANLGYVNHVLLDSLEREIIRKLKITPEFVSAMKDDSQAIDGLRATESFGELEETKVDQSLEDQEGWKFDKASEGIESKGNPIDASSEGEGTSVLISQNENMSLFDVMTQILIYLSKLKVVKPELFMLLKLHFIKHLDQASPNDIVLYLSARSTLYSDMLKKYQTNKSSILNKSIQDIKNSSYMFYNAMMPYLKRNTTQFTLEQASSVLSSALRPYTTNKETKRNIMKFGVEHIPQLENIRDTLSASEYGRLVYKYNTLLQEYATKNEDLNYISESFKKANIDINLICKAYIQVHSKIRLGGIPTEAEDQLLGDKSNLKS